MASLDPPDQVRFRRRRERAIGDQPGARLLQPVQAPFLAQLPAQNVRERLEKMSVVARVSLHARRQRPPGPIGLLRTFFQLHAQVLLHQVEQAEFLLPEQPARHHCVKYPARHKTVLLAQQAQVVIPAVQDQLPLLERLPERLQMDRRQRINQPVRLSHADLQQTQLLGIRVQAVRFGVYRHPISRLKRFQELRQFAIRIYHAPYCIRNSTPEKPKKHPGRSKFSSGLPFAGCYTRK